jgi:YidC/Oxa1 family membrane protein insertase
MNAKVTNENYIELHSLLTTKTTIDGVENTTYLAKYYPNVTAGLNTLKNDKTLAQTSTCLTIDGNDKEPTSGANLEKKDWGYAWKKGPLQGLITYPIAFGLASFTKLIGENGIGQILSILFVTIIVRLIITLATFKQTMQQQKMQLIQPELNAIQVKYQGRTDQASKQKMSQEMMKIYSKYGVNPLKSLIMPFISMPVFLCVYHAVNNTSILKTGTVFGVNLGDAMSTGILQGRWFAIVLFILMVAMQFASMKIPTWMQKYKTKKSGRRPDPRQSDSQKQANMMTNIFFVMIVFMGWMLPTSMTVYWIASSVVSLVQTIITQTMLGKKSKQELMKK